MDLAALFEGVSYTGTLPDVSDPISVVTHDSRKVRPGAVFVCAKGRQTDGHDYAQKALEMGYDPTVIEKLMELTK